MTMCEEHELKIWGFQDGRMAIWRKFNLYRSISTMKILQDPTMLLMTFKSGESYYFGWSRKHKNFRIVLPEEYADAIPSNTGESGSGNHDHQSK